MSRKRIFQVFNDIIVIIVIGIAFFLVNFYVKPSERGFYCNDNDILYPLLPDIVPAYAVGLFAILGTIVFIVLVEFLNVERFGDDKNRKHFITSVYHGISLFALGLSITMLLTEIGKRWIGRLRPHFISVCNPDFKDINCTLPFNSFTQVLKYIDTSGSFCRGDSSLITEARLSFPSGHSSTSFYAMVFLIIYIQARVTTLKLRFVKVFVQLIAFSAAYLTSISRVKDYHHRGSDVIGGAVLGALIAVFVLFVIGKVIWLYNRKNPIYEFESESNQISEQETLYA